MKRLGIGRVESGLFTLVKIILNLSLVAHPVVQRSLIVIDFTNLEGL